MTPLARRRLGMATFALLACLCLVAAASGSVAGQSTNETANATVQHERPEAVGESGNLERLQRWLDGRLADRLGSSTVALSEGEYERARALLGDEYDGRLAQYVEVAGETGTGGEAGETYRAVGDGQRRLATRAEAFERADERYRQAREEGNETAAREAARRMDRLGGQVEATGENVTRGYETLADLTGADTTEERAAVSNVTEDVSERRAEVRAATFVETELTVVEATRTVSYTDPLRVTARAATTNGTALDNRTLSVSVAGRSDEVETDADGRFTLSYRPRTLPVNTTSVRVAYVPRNDSVYLGANASVPVDVEQVTPELTVSDAPAETSYGAPTGARLVVAVDGERVAGVPVVATLDGQELGRETTDGDGAARVESALPASVRPGDRELRAAVPLRDRAVGPANDTVAVGVETTETALVASADRDGGTATVTGRLTTADGRPVAGQSVGVSRNGTTVTTVETGPNGTYEADVPLDPDGSAAGSTVRVGARFDGGGTNLESSRATTTVTVPAGPTGERGGLGAIVDAASWPIAAAVAILILLAATALTWRRRGGDETPSPDPADPTPTDAAPESATDDPTPALDRAEAFLDQGATAAAVRAAYAGVREGYGPDGGSGTHWELLERAQSLAGDERSAIERVVRAYELAVFSPATVGREDASAAVSAARSALDGPGADASLDD